MIGWWFSAAALIALDGCGDNNPDIVGPFTGDTRRYVVDSIDLPTTNPDAIHIADDLDGAKDTAGNTSRDNQMGTATQLAASRRFSTKR